MSKKTDKLVERLQRMYKQGRFDAEMDRIDPTKPQPVDEDFVTDFLEVGMDYYRDVLTIDEANEEIRKLIRKLVKGE